MGNKTKSVIILHPNCTFDVEDVNILTLDMLQNYVGGYIETFPIYKTGEKYIMVFDEEGKLNKKQLNPVATALTGMYPYDVIVGDVVICKVDFTDEDESDLFPLDKNDLDYMQRAIVDRLRRRTK